MKQASSHKWPIILFSIGTFMAGLDNGIISSALTTIYSSFDVTPTWGAWTVTIYTLGLAISVPIVGKLSDNYGRKRLFIIEIFLFGLGSLLVALSPNFTILLIARFIQAVGGGGVFIIASSYILTSLPENKQGKFLGLIGSMHGLSAVLGPNVGALILSLTDRWQWMFIINIPIAIFLIVFALLKMENDVTTKQSKTLDIKGAIYLSLAVLMLMLGITNVDSGQLLSSIITVAVFPYLLAGLLLIIFFINHEKQLEIQNREPIISYEQLKNRSFQMTLIFGFIAGGFLATIIFIPSYVQQVLQISAASSGFWLTPLALASGIGSGLGGALTDKVGSLKTITIAGCIGLVGFLIFIMQGNNLTTFLIASILAGISLGFFLGAPLNVLMSKSTTKDKYGTALGTLSLSRQLGVTLFPTIFASFLTGSVVKLAPSIEGEVSKDVFALAPGETSYNNIMEEATQISDPFLQQQVLDIIAAVMKQGFNHIFQLASLLAVTVIVLAFSFNLITKQK